MENTKSSLILFLILVFISSFLLLSCASSDFLNEDLPKDDLNLPAIRLTENEQKLFRERFLRAQSLFNQYQEFGQIFTLLDTLIGGQTSGFQELLYLPSSKKPSFVLVNLKGDKPLVESLISLDSISNVWDVKNYSSPLRLVIVDSIFADIQNLRQEMLQKEIWSSTLMLIENYKDQLDYYFVPVGSETEFALGGGEVLSLDSLGQRIRIKYGEPTLFRKGEIRYYNFQVANTPEGIPTVKDLLDVLRYEHYFPTHYLNTGKYIFGRVGSLRQKKWIVLDPSNDPQFQLDTLGLIN